MDIKDYEKILHAIPTSGVFIIREDNHKILYYNERVQEIVPHVHIGMTCYEMGNHSCINCPLLSIGDRQENRSLGYNSPFGEIVDIVAVKTLWEGRDRKSVV